MTLSTRARPFTALVGLIQARGSFNHYGAQDARARSGRPTAELVADLRAAAGVRHHPPGTKPEDPLVDVRLRATDAAWERGDPDGDEAAGPLADILLDLAGRAVALERLKGPGVDALARSTPPVT